MNKNIDYYYFKGCSGFATAAKGYIEALKPRWNVRAFPITFHNNIPANNSINVYHCNPEVTKRFKRKHPCIGFATFENKTSPLYWKRELEKNDCVITPSKFNHRIFSKMLDVDVFYIPHCLDFNLWHCYDGSKVGLNQISPGGTSGPKNMTFKFLFLGAWKNRKNYNLLIEAFLREFNKDENVELVLKTLIKTSKLLEINPGCADQCHIHKNVKIIKDKLKDAELPIFMSGFNCLVQPTLGEGFGLPGLQAMAVGLPVITPAFTGCGDYACDDTAFLLHPASFRMINCLDSHSPYQGLSWPVYSTKELRKQMRIVYENKKLREEKANCARKFVHNTFNYEQTEKRWSDMIRKMGF